MIGRIGSNSEWKALDTRVIVVAVQGAIGDWSAYIGAVQGDNHELEWIQVANEGSKLPRRLAEAVFPEWASKLVYRE